MKKEYVKKLLIFNILLIILTTMVKQFLPQFTCTFIKYISFDTDGYNFKDLLSISATILAIFIGFIATIATVIVSMCKERLIIIIKKYDSISVVKDSLKGALVSGTILLMCISIIYVNFDFNILLLRFILIWIIFNCLFIFIYESEFLIFLVKNLVEQTFYDNEDIVINRNNKTNK